ncbi:5'-nucleotidase C-terminal domain-containing protein [Pleionea sp. CnH1-48]|uniref:5'-nucleotidase C-terminal domain-containing protein n=1 Tax=Pleionea sp. CnH1-48 TaxID=2954494 RepID=UPI002097B416|nr:5'-nucleotidase [Pleionea sp. CnH1-48]MCO7223582.1 5'-nucleotidase C-terminal domain-containing protein [Pleionea sp. CnH1-48]
MAIRILITKSCRLLFMTATLFMVLSCSEGNELLSPREVIDDEVLGFTTVELDATKALVRTQEMPIGNFLTDALYDQVTTEGFPLDFALVNGGNIRFNAQANPDAIYPIGELTRADVDNILPFRNTIVIVTATGREVKQVFERGVASLPTAHGGFLQVSRHIQLMIDTSRAAQVVDTDSVPPQIVSAGERVVSLLLNGSAIDPDATYRFSFNNFNTDGGDGYVMLEVLPPERKQDIGLFEDDLLAKYLQSVSVVSPIIESRLIIQ